MNRQQSFLLLCIALSALAAGVILLPFLQYVLGALIFGYVLHPFHRRLAPRVGSMVSPILLILASLVVLVIPFLYIARAFASDVTQLVRGETTIDFPAVEQALFEATGFRIDLSEQVRLGVERLVDVLFGGLTGVVSLGLKLSLGLALVLFLVYYILRDGPRFVAWLRDLIPLPADVTDRLFWKIHYTTWGVVVGHIAVAFLQAIIAGVGLWFFGVPNVVFWTFVMVVLALLPLIGAFLVWGPAAAYLALVGDVSAGAMLALYGVFVVSLVDNYARPILIDQQARLNPGVILVGVFGGVYTLGFAGLFVGPIVFGILAATLETFREDYDRLAAD